MPDIVATLSSLDQVRQILDRAAGTSPADYGGRGRFWHLPLAELLTVEVHGIRMIAPAAAPIGEVPATSETPAAAMQDPRTSSCCCHGEPAPASRSARSGLIQGLLGQPPFDGSRFPRLPWGGQPVGADDLQRIADWIDDGCPGEQQELASLPLGSLTATPALATVAAGNVEPAVARAGAAIGAASSEGAAYPAVRQRMNLDCMSEPEVERLRQAFRELYRLNKWPADRRSYNNQALIHQNHCQHGWERFLPWHRVYLYEVEQALADVAPGVTIPYWDWTMPQYRPSLPQTGWIIPPALKAYLTEASLAFLATADPPLPPDAIATLRRELVEPHTLFTSGTTFFAEVARLIGVEYTTGEHRRRFIDALLAANALWYPLRYPAEYCPPPTPATINTVIHYHYPTARDIAQIQSLRTFRDYGGGSQYNDSFGFLDQNPHNTLHIWTGGMNPARCQGAPDFEQDLGGDRNRGVRVHGRRFHTREDLYGQPQFGDMFSNLTASYDPIFWPIHANVDRLWWEWQQGHPHALPIDLDAVLTPWSYTIADTLEMSRFGYEYVKCATLLPVGLATPVGRFVSPPIAIPEAVRGPVAAGAEGSDTGADASADPAAAPAGFARVEVRLHRVPQLVRSCFVRVFLNLPDADAATPIDHPNYAGYLAIFGHGPCIGGPGHCDLPPARPRPYDLRPRHMNTPRNHRVDVTATARRLLAAGASSLTVTLVAIGADYQEDGEVLRLDGVSLTFLD